MSHTLTGSVTNNEAKIMGGKIVIYFHIRMICLWWPPHWGDLPITCIWDFRVSFLVRFKRFFACLYFIPARNLHSLTAVYIPWRRVLIGTRTCELFEKFFCLFFVSVDTIRISVFYLIFWMPAVFIESSVTGQCGVAVSVGCRCSSKSRTCEVSLYCVLWTRFVVGKSVHRILRPGDCHAMDGPLDHLRQVFVAVDRPPGPSTAP